MRWIVIGFIAFIVAALAYDLMCSLWKHEGLRAIALAALLLVGCICLYGSI